MNTERDLFRHPGQANLRKAVNFAIDRPAMINQRGFAAGVPTDQMIPPNIPGFVDVDIYPLDGPDLVRARELAGCNPDCPPRSAVFYTCNTGACIPIAQIVQANLAAIGIDRDDRPLPDGRVLHEDRDARRALRSRELHRLACERTSMGTSSSSCRMERGSSRRTTSTGPTSTIPSSTRGSSQRGGCHPGRPATARSSQIDVDITRDASPYAPFMIDNSREFFSRRIGCHAYDVLGSSDEPRCVVRTAGDLGQRCPSHRGSSGDDECGLRGPALERGERAGDGARGDRERVCSGWIGLRAGFAGRHVRSRRSRRVRGRADLLGCGCRGERDVLAAPLGQHQWDDHAERNRHDRRRASASTSTPASTATTATTATSASSASATTASGPTAGPLSRAERDRPAAEYGQGTDPSAALPSRHRAQGALQARRQGRRPEPTGRLGTASQLQGQPARRPPLTARKFSTFVSRWRRA